MSPEEPGLLVLLLQEEQEAGLRFGKESHLISFAREATTVNPQVESIQATIILSYPAN